VYLKTIHFTFFFVTLSIFCQAQNKDKKNTLTPKSKLQLADSLKVTPQEKSNFNMNDIEGQLQKINYKPNEIAITVPNPRIVKRTPLKPSDLVEEKKKINAEDTLPKKHPVYVPPQNTNAISSVNESKPSTDNVANEKKDLTASTDSSTATVTDTATDTVTDTVTATATVADTTSAAVTDSNPLDSSVVSNPEITEPTVAGNPFRKEVQNKPTLTPEEQLEQTYSELLIRNKDSASNQSPLFIQKKELDFPMIKENDWKKVTREKMEMALSEQKSLNQKLNQLLKKYYTLNNLTQAAHTYSSSESANDSLNREMAKVYYFLGIAYYNSLDMNQSAESFRKVIQIIPEHEPSFKNISLIYQTNKNQGEEIKNLKSAIYSSDNEKK